ncbi:MAG: hypothetical protein QXU18_14695 [Thermoplasmatales archaeon]
MNQFLNGRQKVTPKKQSFFQRIDIAMIIVAIIAIGISILLLVRDEYATVGGAFIGLAAGIIPLTFYNAFERKGHVQRNEGLRRRLDELLEENEELKRKLDELLKEKMRPVRILYRLGVLSFIAIDSQELHPQFEKVIERSKDYFASLELPPSLLEDLFTNNKNKRSYDVFTMLFPIGQLFDQRFGIQAVNQYFVGVDIAALISNYLTNGRSWEEIPISAILSHINHMPEDAVKVSNEVFKTIKNIPQQDSKKILLLLISLHLNFSFLGEDARNVHSLVSVLERPLDQEDVVNKLEEVIKSFGVTLEDRTIPYF